MTTPRLPDLSPDLHWLIHMPPIRKALDEYYYGFPQNWVPAGAHKDRMFTTSNIFASALASPPEQSAYDLIIDYETADKDYTCTPSWEDVLTLEREVTEEQAQVFAVNHPEKTHDEWLGVLGSISGECQEFFSRQNITPCHALANYWCCTLERYQRQPHPVFSPSANHGVQPLDLGTRPWAQEYIGEWPTFRTPHTLFDPHVSLPRRKLIEELRTEYATHHLMLLTARHELGSIYEEVRAWSARVDERGGLDPRDTCLMPWQAGLLSARARGRRSWALGPASDALHRRRDDNPVEKVDTQCDLSRLYHQLFTWCKATYDAAIAPPLCKRAGCERTTRPRADGRGWRPYCSDECSKPARQKTFRRSSRKYRATTKRSSVR